MKFWPFVLLLLSTPLLAEWKAELVARASLKGSTFNMPPGSMISNTSPRINNYGDILLKLVAINLQPKSGVWLQLASEKQGKVIFETKDGQYLGDPQFNNYGETLFHYFDEEKSHGLFYYHPERNLVVPFITPDQMPDTVFFGAASINDLGHVLFRSLNSDGTRSLILIDGDSQTVIDDDRGENSYLFTPSLNNLGGVALKVRLGPGIDEQRPDQIRLYGQSVSHTIEARDRDDKKNSPYTAFNNHVALSSSEHVVFIATHDDGHKELLQRHVGRTTVVAKEGEGDIGKLEYFKPAVNNWGEIVFRAFDKDGHRSLFVYSNHRLTKLVREGDHLPCDLADDCYVTLKTGYPGISGNPDLNDWGEVVVHLILNDKKMKNLLGAGIYRFTQQALD